MTLITRIIHNGETLILGDNQENTGQGIKIPDRSPIKLRSIQNQNLIFGVAGYLGESSSQIDLVEKALSTTKTTSENVESFFNNVKDGTIILEDDFVMLISYLENGQIVNKTFSQWPENPRLKSPYYFDKIHFIGCFELNNLLELDFECLELQKSSLTDFFLNNVDFNFNALSNINWNDDADCLMPHDLYTILFLCIKNKGFNSLEEIDRKNLICAVKNMYSIINTLGKKSNSKCYKKFRTIGTCTVGYVVNISNGISTLDI